MPRSLKMATAAGDKASEINTRGAKGLLQKIGADCCPSPAREITSHRAGLFAPGRSSCGAAVDPWLGESSRLGEVALGLRKGEIEPRGQRLDIARLDGRAAPDPKAGRRIAI